MSRLEPIHRHPHILAACLGALPVVSARLSMGVPVSAAGWIDTAAAAIALYCGFSGAARFQRAAIRGALLAGLALAANAVVFGNLLYFRFFQTWLPLDVILFQWRDVPALGSSIWALSRTTDWIVFVIAPAILTFTLMGRTIRPSLPLIYRPALLGLLVLALHTATLSPALPYGENDPLFRLVRKAVLQGVQRQAYRSALKANAGEIRRFTSLDPSAFEFVADPAYPFQKIPIAPSTPASGTRPNVVLVMMESVRAAEMGAYGSGLGLTPAFDAAARRGILLKTFYANGAQTVRSEFATLTSFPPALDSAPNYRKHPNLSIISLPEILKTHGYQTSWISGFPPDYGNKRAFLSRHGVDRFHHTIADPERVLGWGPSDEDIFSYATSVLSAEKEPFFAEIMTLSNHFPSNYDYPTNASLRLDPGIGPDNYRNYLEGIHYTDHALGKFLRQAADTDWGRRTLFVITSDNGVWVFSDQDAVSRVGKQEIFSRVPALLYAPGMLAPGVIDAVASHVDLAPTILGFLGIRAPNSFIGRNLFMSPDKDPVAFMLRDERWSMRRGNEYLYDVGPESFRGDFTNAGGSPNPGAVPHEAFTFDGDLLVSGAGRAIRPLPPDRVAGLTAFAEKALTLYRVATVMNRISNPAYRSGPGNRIGRPSERSRGDRPRLIAHAGGMIDETIYSNSREALDHNYKAGFRVFEIDFLQTADDKWVLLHSWKDMAGPGWTGGLPSFEAFDQWRAKQPLTRMTLEELIAWLKEHPDSRIVADVKVRYGTRGLLEHLRNRHAAVMNRFIPQAPSMIDAFHAEALGFNDILLTLYWGEFDTETLNYYLSVRSPYGVVVPYQMALATDIVARLKATSTFVYAHTVNRPATRRALERIGVDGFFADAISPPPESQPVDY